MLGARASHDGSQLVCERLPLQGNLGAALGPPLPVGRAQPHLRRHGSSAAAFLIERTHFAPCRQASPAAAAPAGSAAAESDNDDDWEKAEIPAFRPAAQQAKLRTPPQQQLRPAPAAGSGASPAAPSSAPRSRERPPERTLYRPPAAAAAATAAAAAAAAATAAAAAASASPPAATASSPAQRTPTQQAAPERGHSPSVSSAAGPGPSPAYWREASWGDGGEDGGALASSKPAPPMDHVIEITGFPSFTPDSELQARSPA